MLRATPYRREREFRLPNDVELYGFISRDINSEGAAQFGPDGLQVSANVGIGRSVSASDRVDAFAAGVTFDHIVRIERQMFSGHVYNLETGSAWYFANGIVAHNCRCRAVTWHPDWARQEEAA